jgi:hypothetical protein
VSDDHGAAFSLFISAAMKTRGISVRALPHVEERLGDAAI